MKIEERGYSMITDEKGMEWLFQKLYDAGWRYLIKDNYDNLYLTDEKPYNDDDVDEIRLYSCEKAIGASAFRNVFPELKRNGCISIAERLGIIDWSEVKVDTPVLVKANKQGDWEKRYFAYFKDGRVYAWLYGTTSWSTDNDEDVMSWNYAKLAEV